MKGISGILALGLALACLTPRIVHAENWGSTTAEELGITQAEFKKVKESGMSKSRLLKLLEIGVTPNEYFSEPWKKLGVTESYWLSQKKVGFADDDMNQTYHRSQSAELAPFVSFVLPGFYQYQSHRPVLGAALSATAVASVATLVLAHKEVTPVIPAATLGAALGAHASRPKPSAAVPPSRRS